jgi:aryl-alcohol dehydrogenase-like predicted oxidoreductase
MTIEVTASSAGTVRLGDLEVPRLGFGAMRLPGPGVWGPPDDRDEAIRTVRHAVDLGVRVIDSAWYYGRDVANEVIAAAIRPYPDDLVLVTKLGGARTDDGGWFNGITPNGLRAGCERDLRVLGVETVPVVHLRWMDGAPISFDEALDVMVDLRTEGKIGRIGLSNVTADQLTTALSRTPIVSVSNLFGPAEQGDAATLDLCAAHGIAYLPFFPLAAGRVARRTTRCGPSRTSTTRPPPRSRSHGCSTGRRPCCPFPAPRRWPTSRRTSPPARCAWTTTT